MSIHLLLAAAAAVAMQGQDPLAPLPTQPAPAKPLMVEVPNAQPASTDPAWTTQPSAPPPAAPVTVTVTPLTTPPQPVVAVRRSAHLAGGFFSDPRKPLGRGPSWNHVAPAKHPDSGCEGRTVHGKGLTGRFARPDPSSAHRSSRPAAGKPAGAPRADPWDDNCSAIYRASANHMARQFSQPLQGEGRLGRACCRPASIAA